MALFGQTRLFPVKAPSLKSLDWKFGAAAGILITPLPLRIELQFLQITLLEHDPCSVDAEIML